jgi:hypothetical protein
MIPQNVSFPSGPAFSDGNESGKPARARQVLLAMGFCVVIWRARTPKDRGVPLDETELTRLTTALGPPMRTEGLVYWPLCSIPGSQPEEHPRELAAASRP